MVRSRGERGYSWLAFHMSKQWVMTFLVAALVIALAVIIYLAYRTVSRDLSPDSILGYTFAILGTFFMLLAAVRYMLYRRSRKRGVGQLNVSLHWHMCFGFIALALLFLHSFGNFNPRSGTYALFGMVALVISGVIGRLFDRMAPRMMAGAVDKALTAQGEDRLEAISQTLQAIVVHNTREEVRGFAPARGMSFPGLSNGKAARKKEAATSLSSSGGGGGALQTPWDLAYISLDETPQEVNRDNQQYRFVPDRKSALAQPGALIPGAKEHMEALHDIQQALQREQFFRYLVRYWRIFHIALALVTVALTLWHLEFAATLLIPVYFH